MWGTLQNVLGWRRQREWEEIALAIVGLLADYVKFFVEFGHRKLLILRKTTIEMGGQRIQ